MADNELSGAVSTDRSKKAVITTPETSPFIKGRREFFTYRDLGMMEATNGAMSATITKGKRALDPTGWHYHGVDIQFLYFLKGWVKLEFEDGTTRTVKAGDSLYIPGGLKHNEFAGSDDLEVLEVMLPGKITTYPCDAP